MDRKPLFPLSAKVSCPTDFIRNCECPHYEVCLEEASNIDFYLDCSICEYRNTRDNEFIFQFQYMLAS